MKRLIARMLTHTNDEIVRLCLESAKLVPTRKGEEIHILGGAIVLSIAPYFFKCTTITISGNKTESITSIKSLQSFIWLAKRITYEKAVVAGSTRPNDAPGRTRTN